MPRPGENDYPNSTVGAGTRGPGTEFILSVFGPYNVGYTINDAPVLYWFVSERVELPIDITFAVDGAIEPLLEVRNESPIPKGIHAFKLADYGLSLEQDTTYIWSATTITETDATAKDALVRSWIRRVPVTSPFRDLLSTANRTDWPGIYAQCELWYDAIEEVSTQIRSAPTDKALRNQRAELLEYKPLNLLEAAAYDRRIP